MEKLAGIYPASPSATAIRPAKSDQYECARPHAAVATLQTTAVKPMMARRGYLSASRPRGTAHAAYIRAKEADSMAARESVSENSCLITGKNAANAMRSMKFSIASAQMNARAT